MTRDGVSFRLAITSGGGDMVKGDVWHDIHSRFKLKETQRGTS